MLGATRVDDPKTNFDNLPITEEFVFGNRNELGSMGLGVKTESHSKDVSTCFGSTMTRLPSLKVNFLPVGIQIQC